MVLGKYMIANARAAPDSWAIRSRRGDLLGVVSYYKPWRQYVFESAAGAVFSHECLRELARFCANPAAEDATADDARSR